MKCQCCKKEDASWSWQPFGPGENANTFILPGDHHRGFPVVKVCTVCKNTFTSGSEVSFLYKRVRFVGKDHKVEEMIYPNWEEAQEAMDRGETVRVEQEPFTIDPYLLQIAQALQDKDRLEEWKKQQRS